MKSLIAILVFMLSTSMALAEEEWDWDFQISEDSFNFFEEGSTDSFSSATGHSCWMKGNDRDTFSYGGCLHGDVRGEGLRVDTISGEISTGRRMIRGEWVFVGICNWFYQIEFIDSEGRTYERREGIKHSGCQTYFKNPDPSGPVGNLPPAQSRETFQINKEVKVGRVCVKLFKDHTKYVESACFDIKKKRKTGDDIFEFQESR